MKLLAMLCMIMISAVCFAQDLDLEVYPQYFKELHPDKSDEASMICGFRFSIVNPNPRKISSIVIKDFSVYSESRGLVAKRHFHPECYRHLEFISIEPYKEFPYLDLIMAFGKSTLNKYNSGEETLYITYNIAYLDENKDVYHKDFKWSYSQGKFKPEETGEP